MIKLRDFAARDAARLQALANNKNVSGYLVYTFPFPYTHEDAELWISTGSKDNSALNRVIEYEGEFVGTVGITPQAGWRDHIAEIGYWVGEPYWSRGIATAAVREMTEYAFGALQYRKIFAPVLAPNKASMRVLAKCGYDLECVLRAEVYKDGCFFDIHQYAKLAE
jgi:ribosomal-protein-alanine N-acetyltransferase